MSVAPISAPTAKAPAQFNAAALRRAAPEVQRAAVAQQFEAVLVRQLLGKTLNSMLGGEGGGVSGSVYGDMLADTISQQLTAGQGLGLGRFIQQQLAPKHDTGSAAKDAAPPEPAAVSTPSSPVSTK
jgi:Rod binding domain-containing protein